MLWLNGKVGCFSHFNIKNWVRSKTFGVLNLGNVCTIINIGSKPIWSNGFFFKYVLFFIIYVMVILKDFYYYLVILLCQWKVSCKVSPMVLMLLSYISWQLILKSLCVTYLLGDATIDFLGGHLRTLINFWNKLILTNNFWKKINKFDK